MSTTSRPSGPVAGPAPSQQSPPPQEQQQTTDDKSAHQLALAVDDLLNQLQLKFDKVSTEIFGKLDDMARRLDQLESSLIVSGEPGRSN